MPRTDDDRWSSRRSRDRHERRHRENSRDKKPAKVRVRRQARPAGVERPRMEGKDPNAIEDKKTRWDWDDLPPSGPALVAPGMAPGLPPAIAGGSEKFRALMDRNESITPMPNMVPEESQLAVVNSILEKRKKRTGNWDAGPQDVVHDNAAQLLVQSALTGGSRHSQNSRQSRRMYVGNLPDAVREEQLVKFFNRAMNELRTKMPAISENPILSCQMGPDRHYCFLEVETPEDASCGMSLDNILFQGVTLRVRRPKDFQPGMAAATTGSGMIPVSYSGGHRVLLANIPLTYTQEQIKALIETFGEVKMFDLVHDIEGQFQGSLFFEYEDAECARQAMATLNGLKVQGKLLRCQLASLGTRVFITKDQVLGVANMPTEAQTAVALVESFDLLKTNPTLMQQAAATAVQGMKPSSVIQLLNMFTREQLLDEDQYREIMQDILNELKVFGPVIKLLMPRPESLEDDTVPGEGKVFAQFGSLRVAKRARLSINGRKFQGRTVVASFFPENMFREDDLT